MRDPTRQTDTNTRAEVAAGLRTGVLLALLFLPGSLLGAPPRLVIPPEVKPSGQYAQLVPDTDAVSITYVGLDRVDPIPSAVLKDARLFLLDTRGLPEGRYRFVAVGAGKDGEQTRADFAVLVGDNPPPVPPGPGPGPTPGPVDDLTKLLQAAYDKDTDAAKARHLPLLVELYKQASELAAKTDLKTWGQFNGAIRAAANELGFSKALVGVQEVVNDKITGDLPTEAQRPISDDERAKAKEAYAKAALALKGVK
jgi:hypothetical protein